MGLFRRRAGGPWAVALTTLCSGAPAEEPKQQPRRLKLDVERHVERVLEKDDRLRFEERVEVVARSPQQQLQRFVEGAELDCEPAGVGAPTELEMREVRPGPAPYVDLLALAGAALAQLKKKGPPRFFVYRVTRVGKASYLVREGGAPQGWAAGPGGVSIELVDSFPDRKSALAAWQRLERGLEGPPKASPPPPFLSSACRPGS